MRSAGKKIGKKWSRNCKKGLVLTDVVRLRNLSFDRQSLEGKGIMKDDGKRGGGGHLKTLKTFTA